MMSRRVIGIVLLMAVVLTGLFAGFCLLAKQKARVEIKLLQNETAKLKSSLAAVKADLVAERNLPGGTEGEAVFMTATEVYDFFMESAALAQLNVVKATVKQPTENPVARIPLELTLNGNYPHLLSFFNYLTDRHCLYSIDKFAITALTADPANTLQCTTTVIVPLRREAKP